MPDLRMLNCSPLLGTAWAWANECSLNLESA